MSKRIGEILVEKKVLKEDQVQQIIAHSLAHNLSFGDAGADLGLLSREKLVRSLGPSFSADWFDLQPQYLPKSTQELFSTDEMIEYGVIGLGVKKGYGFFKSSRLNLGMVNPENKSALEKVVARLPAEYKKTKIFLVPADRFIETLEKVFGVRRSVLAGMEPSKINPMLSLFLDR